MANKNSFGWPNIWPRPTGRGRFGGSELVLEDQAQPAHHVLGEAAVAPVLVRHLLGLLERLEEEGLHLGREGGVVDRGVQLTVEEEAARVEVGGTERDEAP